MQLLFGLFTPEGNFTAAKFKESIAKSFIQCGQVPDSQSKVFIQFSESSIDKNLKIKPEIMEACAREYIDAFTDHIDNEENDSDNEGNDE